MAVQKLWRQVAPLLFFILVACLALYRPLFHATTHIPGRYTTDYFHFHWNMWWIRHALTHADASVYSTNYVLFPFTSNLAYHTLTPFWFPLWAILEPLIGTLAVFEVFYVIALCLTGYFFYLWMRHEGVSSGLSLVGGVALEIAPAVLYFVTWSMMDLIAWFWLPVQLLAWSQVVHTADHRWLGWLMAAAQGVLFWAMGLTDMQYFLYGGLLLIPFGVLTLFRARNRRRRARLVARGALAVAVGAALLWFFGPLSHMAGFDRSGLVPPPVETAPSLTFPGSFTNLTPDLMAYPVVGAYLLPLLLLSLAIYLTPWRRCTWRGQDRRWFWLGLAVLPWLVSMGASITILGEEIDLPYRWVYTLSGGLLRFPFRFGLVFMVPLLIFIAQTWQPLLTGRTPRLVASGGGLLLILATTNVLHSTAVQPAPVVYNFYRTMGAEALDYVVVEVPVAAGTGEYWIGNFTDIETEFYGTVHGKRMVNGFVSRTPLDYYWYLRDSDPMLSWLGQRRLLDPVEVEKQLRERVFGWPIGYIVVHQDRIGLEGPTNQEIIGYFNSLSDLLCPFAVEGPAVAYRTAWHPGGCPPRLPPEVQPSVYRIDIGNPDDVRFIGAGWHWSEHVFDTTLRWTGNEPRATLFADLPPGDYHVTISAQAFWEPRQLRLLVNGVPIGDPVAVPTEGLTALPFDVPAEVMGSGQHVEFTLDCDGWVVAAEVGQSADQRRLAVAVDWVELARGR